MQQTETFGGKALNETIKTRIFLLDGQRLREFEFVYQKALNDTTKNYLEQVKCADERGIAE